MGFRSIYKPLQLPQTNILAYLNTSDSLASDKPIWIDAENPNQALSLRQALIWIKRLAIAIESQHVSPGEVVTVFTPNHIFVPVAYLGIAGSNRIFSGVNPALTTAEVAHQLRGNETRLLLAHPSLLTAAIQAAHEAGLPKERVFQFSDTPCQAKDGILDWRTIAGPDSDHLPYVWPKLGAAATTTTAAINYSSGTTGLPKGVCISHYNIVANSEQTIFIRDQDQPYSASGRPEERWIGFLPLYHAYGQLWMCVMAPKLQITVYVMKKFVYEDFLRYIQEYKATHLQVVPPILTMLDKRPETGQYDLSGVKNILCGAAPLSKELQSSLCRRFKVNIIQGWGMTELTCGAIHVPGGVYDDSGSVGRLHPNCECMLIDDEGNEITQPGTPGELCIKGPQVCLGYWKNEEATNEIMFGGADRWLKSGDIAVIKDNWFWIVDRKKELIKVNGLQVAPAELEAVLLQNDSVADAAVVRITIDGQELPRAYVALKDDRCTSLAADDIASWMSSRVAKHKQLAGGIRFVDSVPRLASGKIERKVVRQWSKRDEEMMEKRHRARL